jgi:iron complex outermembrane receptor protein
MKTLNYSTISIAVVLGLASITSHADVLEVIEVTAQKRIQSVQDVGISITAFSGDQIEALGYDNAQEITAMAPGVTAIQPNGPSAFYINIRGVAQNDFSGDHQESPVAIYLDEAYISASSGAGFQLFDIERVEILKGPQGTLFGRNATGGLVHYISRKPTDTFEGFGKITFGSYNQILTEGAVGGALTDKLSSRFSFTTNNHDPYINNTLGTDLNNGDDWAARLQFLLEVTDDVDWLVSARRGEQDIDSGFFEHTSARLNPATGLGESFDGPNLTTSAYQEPDNGVFTGSYDKIGFNKVQSQGITSNLQWDFGDILLTSITDLWSLEKDYIEDSDASAQDYYNFFLKSEVDQFSQELRLNGQSDNSRWVAGLYYLDIDGAFANGGEVRGFVDQLAGEGAGTGAVTGGPLTIWTPFNTTTETYSVFAQLEYDVAQQWTLIGGLRWANEEKSMDYAQNYVEMSQGLNPSAVNIVDPDPFGFGGPLFVFNDDTFDFATTEDDYVTAKAEVDFSPTNDTLLYLSYNRGIKSGGYNAPLDISDFLDGNPQTGGPQEMKFDQETLHAYEFGVKHQFSPDLRINGAVYYYDYDDYQAFRLEGLTTFVFNTDASIKGAELEITANPIDNLELLLGTSYIDNNVKDAYQLPNGELLDRRAVVTPEWNINGLARYGWQVADGELAAQIDFVYMSEHFFQLKNSPVGEQSGYALFNARISYTSNDGKWMFAGFVDNLLDKEYRVMAFDLAAAPEAGGFGMVENYYGKPRWWGLSATYHFE